MSDNNTESEKRLQEIGNQLGTPILSPTTKIDTSTDNEPQPQPTQQYSEEDLTGTSDSLSKSKNPMLQYLVAGAIGLGVVGVPLSVLFGLGGTTPSQTAVKPTTEVEEEYASIADKELESLKTESALDIQAKTEAQTVAQTAAPKKAPTVTTQKPQPVAKVAPQPKKPSVVAVPKPTVVPATPAPVQPAPVTLPVARVMPKPIAQPIKQAIPVPVRVAAKPIAPVKPVKPIAPVEPPLSFEQASALGNIGSESIPVDNGNGNGAMALNAVESNLSPSLSLPVGANVLAHTVTPYTAISSRNNANSSTTETPLAVQFDQPIQLAQGFSLPAGTIVQFGAAVADNGAVTATSRGVFVNGTEIKVPAGAFALTAGNNTALVASQRSPREGELSGADNTAAMWGAAGTVGKALAESGNTSVVNSSGLGTSIVQTNSGNVNIPGALLNGAFSPLAKAKESRANALAQELQQSSKLNEIPVRSSVRVFVVAAAAVQIPVASGQAPTLGSTQSKGSALERSTMMSPATPNQVATNPALIAPTKPNNAPTQQPTALITQPVVAPTQQPTAVITQPVVAPTKPNNAPTQQPAAVITQPVVAPTQQPTAVITQPVVAPTQQPAAVITQPVVAPTKPNNAPTQQPTAVITQPVVAPTQQPAAVITQPVVAPTQQPAAVITQPIVAPTKPNNIVTSERAIGRAANTSQPPATTQPISEVDDRSGLRPIQLDAGGNLQPAPIPTGATAPN